MKRLFYILTLIPLVMHLGCLPSESRKELTYDAKWWGELYPNAILELKQDMLARDTKLAPAYMAPDIPSDGGCLNVDKYKLLYPNGSYLLSTGTKLRCTKLFLFKSVTHAEYEVECMIVNGPRAGDQIWTSSLAEGDSYRFYEPGTLKVNERFARLVKSEPASQP